MTRKIVLVTGANGFLGSHVTRSLLAYGCRVIAVCRTQFDTRRLDDIKHKIHIIDMDITLQQATADAINFLKPDIIINCAAYGVDYRAKNKKLCFDVNVCGAGNLAISASLAGVQRFVQIGSCFEYGSKNGNIAETEPLSPTDVYGATKAASSNLILHLFNKSDMKVTVLRPFGLWGPSELPNRLVPLVVNACIKNQPLKLTALEHLRDYSYVMDVADWICCITLHDNFPKNEILNLGTGPVRLRDFVSRIAELLDGLHLLKFGKLPYRPDEMMKLVADTTKLNQLLVAKKVTPIDVGVKDLVSDVALQKLG
jgi:nucleoside-diphosphate-sugar epimerase